MSQLPSTYEVEIHAYVLMTNHYHLLARSRSGQLSAAMQWLDGQYARAFNWQHERRGALFQGRFVSKLIADDGYLHTVGTYIHRNPADAGIVDRSIRYPWSSMPAYVGLAPVPPWLSTDLLLADHSIDSYAVAVDEQTPAALTPSGSRASTDASPRELAALVMMSTVERSVAELTDMTISELHRPVADNSARRLAIAIMATLPDVSAPEVGDRYGISRAAVQKMLQRVRRRCAADAAFASMVGAACQLAGVDNRV